MDALIRQMRVRYPGVGQESSEKPNSVREQRIPPQKTLSFKGDRKKASNWFLNQFTRQMSWDYDSNDGIDHTTAVAAAAYAINSQDEAGIPEKKRTSEGRPESSLAKTKSKKEDTISVAPEVDRGLSKRFTGELSMKSKEYLDSKPGNAIGPAPSIKKTPTFADKNLDSRGSIKPQNIAPKSDLPSTVKPPIPPTESIRRSYTGPGVGEDKADVWEKAELAKIKERYEVLNAAILSWEKKKKLKARRKLDKTESASELKRAKALQHFRNEMERIDQITDGAKAQAEERRRNKELKAKEKANIIRTTGKLPRTCLCF